MSLNWYKERGLTQTKTHVADRDCMHYNAGDTYTTTEITEHYSCGRIDVRGTDDIYGSEIGVPPMRSEDWRAFGRWLDNVETMSVWTLQDLIAAYQNQTGNTVRWDTYARKD